MKLYYSPGACSLSPHIALKEAGMNFEAVLVTMKTHTLADGSDFYKISPLGYVPLLELDDGTRLTEGPAIVQYIADQVPTKNLAPANGTVARAQMQSWLNFIGTELHKSFAPLFKPGYPEELKPGVRAHIVARMTWVDSQLAGKDFLMGSAYNVADGYLFTVAGWTKFVGIDISALANLGAFVARVAARPAVVAAMTDEGLIK